jgi:hypothetical protein
MRGVRLVCVVGVAAALAVIAVTERTAPEPLREVYTPTYRHVPASPPVGATIAHLWRDLHGSSGQAFLRRMVPNEAGVLWLSLLVALMVAFDFDRLANPRNVDLLAMQAIGLCLFEIIRFLKLLQDPVYVALMGWVFSALFALNVFLIGRALWRLRRPAAAPWTPALGARALVTVASILVACDVMAALVREPDDVGFFVNLGAQRLRERGALPYGDPLLTGSPGAAYGPLLYVAHLPFQLALSPGGVNADSPDRPPLGEASTYNTPPPLATKLCTIAFHLAGVAALFTIGARMRSRPVGWALVALYAGSAFVLGVGGDDYYIGGMTYISHIAPTAATLVAFALLPTPMLAGAALAVAAGIGFYPAFMAPAWLGYYWDRDRGRRAFLAAFVVGALAIAVPVLLLSHPANGRGLIGTILWDTFGHHTDPRHYGFSPFSFWGQRGGLRGWLNHPLIVGSNLTTPLFVTFLALAAASFQLARRRRPAELALVTAVIAIAASLQKIHPTGTYVAWACPFLLIGFFADSAVSRPQSVARPGIESDVEYVARRSAS